MGFPTGPDVRVRHCEMRREINSWSTRHSRGSYLHEAAHPVSISRARRENVGIANRGRAEVNPMHWQRSLDNLRRTRMMVVRERGGYLGS